MNEALLTALTFPTLPLSILLAFVIIYWLLAATGLMDIDSIEPWVDAADVGDLVQGADASSTSSSTAAFFSRIGLSGVPFMVSMSILAFFTWAFTYYVHLFFLSNANPALRWLLGMVALLGCFVLAVMATVVVLKPLRILLRRVQPVDVDSASLLGKEGVVMSPVVDATGGRAEFDNGGAGLILQVKSMGSASYQRGDHVVIMAHNHKEHVFEVMSKEEFYFQK